MSGLFAPQDIAALCNRVEQLELWLGDLTAVVQELTTELKRLPSHPKAPEPERDD